MDSRHQNTTEEENSDRLKKWLLQKSFHFDDYDSLDGMHF